MKERHVFLHRHIAPHRRFFIDENKLVSGGKHKTKIVFKSIFDENTLADYVFKEMKGVKDTSNIITYSMLFS
jgi:hypothetical protein